MEVAGARGPSRPLEQLVEPGRFVAGAHLDSPGVARVRRAGDGYALEHLGPTIA